MSHKWHIFIIFQSLLHDKWLKKRMNWFLTGIQRWHKQCSFSSSFYFWVSIAENFTSFCFWKEIVLTYIFANYLLSPWNDNDPIEWRKIVNSNPKVKNFKEFEIFFNGSSSFLFMHSLEHCCCFNYSRDGSS